MKTPDANPDPPSEAWDALFRQRLGNYTDAPPVDALKRILAGANPPRPSAYGRWLPLSLAALLLIGIGGWLFVRKASQVLQPLAVTAPQNRLIVRPRPATPETVLPAQIPTGQPVPDNPRTTIGATSETSALPAGSVPEPFGRSQQLTMASPARGLKPLVTDVPTMNGTDKSLNNATWLTKTDKSPGSRRPAVATNRPLTIVTPRLPASNQPPADGAKPERSPDNQRGQNDDRQAVLKPARDRLGAGLADRYAVLEPSVLPVQEAGSRLPLIDALINLPFRPLPLTATLPAVEDLTRSPAAPQASRAGRQPAWFVSLTPLYNYQQINPIHTDAELVSDIRVARPLATDRLGGRLQVGTEWQLTNRLRLRTSLVYQQVRQSLRYAVQSTQPDSVQVVVTNQSVQVTPVFTRRSYTETATWHYAGLSADLVWSLNRPTSSLWQHYLTVGTTLGRFMSRGGAVNGFVQAGYGIERPLTTGVRLRVEPTVQLGWQALTDAQQRLQSRPYGYGLALGLRFR